MRLLTDENVARSVTDGLRAAGHDVLDVKDSGWHGISDSRLVQIADQEKRIVITHDADFLYQLVVSVVLIRLRYQRPRLVLERILQVFKDQELCARLERSIARLIITDQSIQFQYARRQE